MSALYNDKRREPTTFTTFLPCYVYNITGCFSLFTTQVKSHTYYIIIISYPITHIILHPFMLFPYFFIYLYTHNPSYPIYYAPTTTFTTKPSFRSQKITFFFLPIFVLQHSHNMQLGQLLYYIFCVGPI